MLTSEPGWVSYGSSLGKNLGGTGQGRYKTNKCEDTMAASVSITRGLNNNSREVVKTVDCSEDRTSRTEERGAGERALYRVVPLSGLLS